MPHLVGHVLREQALLHLHPRAVDHGGPVDDLLAGKRRLVHPGQGQPHGGPVEGDAGPVAPRPVLPRVVRLVEHHERVARDPGDVGGAAGHLLVGGDHPVDVGGQAAVGGGPARLEVQVERLGGGKDALAPVWRGPSWLPTLDEIREPHEWVERVRLSEELVT